MRQIQYLYTTQPPYPTFTIKADIIEIDQHLNIEPLIVTKVIVPSFPASSHFFMVNYDNLWSGSRNRNPLISTEKYFKENHHNNIALANYLELILPGKRFKKKYRKHVNRLRHPPPED